jgi:hypothetical protein
LANNKQACVKSPLHLFTNYRKPHFFCHDYSRIHIIHKQHVVHDEPTLGMVKSHLPCLSRPYRMSSVLISHSFCLRNMYMQVLTGGLLLLNDMASTKEGSNNLVMHAIVPAIEAAARRCAFQVFVVLQLAGSSCHAAASHMVAVVHRTRQETTKIYKCLPSMR